MAYLRERKQEVEIDFPIKSVWDAIPKAAAELDWEIKEKNEGTHSLIIETADSLSSYSSELKIELTSIEQKSTHMAVYGETPVTTITSTLEFGQTFDRIDEFVTTLAEIMNS